ncbi:RHS repeat-associated core domain-containing protein, partial [Pseudomonas sp.]|uniref:RHS repeat-associated core domain-containing protein n=1 Tax=Pseudomonas sp. TaxID=306 RepID=UPI003C5FB9A5
NTTTLQYDHNGTNGVPRLLSITDALGQVTHLFYNLASDRLKITQVTDPFGRSAYFQYDSQGRLTSSTDVMGMVSSFTYDSNSVMNSMTTPYGTTTMTQSDTPTQRYVQVVNPLGQTERVEFDVENPNVSSMETTFPSDMSAYNTALDQNNTYYWDRRAYGDAVAAGSAPGTAGSYSFAKVSHWMTAFQGLLPVAASEKKALENRVWYAYPGQTSAGLLPDGGIGSPAETERVLDNGTTQTSSASYNASGLVTQSVDPLGRTTNYSYDPNNGIDLLQVTQTNGSGQDVLSTMTYNSLHEPLTAKDASGQTTTMTYNAQGQLLTRTVVVNAQNQVTTMVYDGNGYLQSVTGPVAGATTGYAYDSFGRVHTVTDSEGYIVTTTYDNLDRPIATTYPDGTSDQTVYLYLDAVKQIDRQGRKTLRQYDAIRQLSQTTDPLGRTTKYTWCTCGGLSTLTDANGNVTTWNLDTEGRVTAKIYADSSRINYVYENSTSRLHQMTDARGNVAVYTYNLDNTLASTAYTPAGGVAATPNVSFAYDPVYNRLTGMTDGTGTTTYTYNPITGSVTTGAGRLGSVSVPIAGSSATVTYAYDELGRVVTRGVDASTTNANNVSTTFDALGRATNVTNPLGAFIYAYVDQTSRLSGVTYPSSTGLNTSYSYFNNVGDQRLQEIKNLKGSTPLSKFDYTYNAVGTIATWTQQADSGTAVVNTLSYDNADQLTNAVQSGGGSASNAYSYDPAGNRLAEKTQSTTTTGRFNNLNQLTAYSGGTVAQTVSGHVVVPASVTVDAVPATVTQGTNFSANVPLPNGTNVLSVVALDTSGNTTTQRFQAVISGTLPPSLSYDANGNVLTDENGNAYQWDALNRLISITYPGGASSLFAYDGLSRRISIIEKNSGGTVTSTKNYLWIGQEIAEERDSSNNVTKRFFPQGEQQAATPYYYTSDHLGSIREMLNGSGTIVARYSYDSYGRATLVSGTNLATFQYADYYAHQPSGLNLTLFRAYDPNTARWLSRDPLPNVEMDQGANLYEYAANDPAKYFDVLGLAIGADDAGRKCDCKDMKPVEEREFIPLGIPHT